MVHCTLSAPAVRGRQCDGCPECGGPQFGYEGECYCVDCTRYVPVDEAPGLTRDEAFAKVEKLMWWWCARLEGRTPADREELFQEACVYFFRQWKPTLPAEHLKAFGKYMVFHAVKSLARKLRGFGCHGFRGHGDDVRNPEGQIPDRPRHAGLEPDERADLHAALATLLPARRDEVERRFGIGRHREHGTGELARRFGGGRQAPAERLKRSLSRLARQLTPS
jgi:DNA-directed RNA polymerase specialized sigma24 family protein